MFDEIAGLPAHPLLIHAAVVFAPLLVLGVVVYGLVPPLRSKIGWAVVALAVLAPLTLWAAKLSGGRLRASFVERGFSPEILDKVDHHMSFGDAAAWAGTALGVVTLALVYVGSRAARRPATSGLRAVLYGLIVAAFFLAAATGYYVVMAGDTGARAVWGS